MTNLKTLVLNADYMPVSLFPLQSIPVQDAVTRVFNGTCHTVLEYDIPIMTPTLKMNWPSVIARNRTDRFTGKVILTDQSLYYRDHGICMYCEKFLAIKETTIDHVIPRSKGGGNNWDNVVIACATCNHKKGNRLPVGEWRPKRQPFKPTYDQLLSAVRKFPITVSHDSWIPFLGKWNAEIRVNLSC
jgi:5-methylcytosine-specific restriction endonuclease McrA